MIVEEVGNKNIPFYKSKNVELAQAVIHNTACTIPR